MARIAIVKVRSAHDVEWRLPAALDAGLGLLGQRHLRSRLRATQGQPFMPQLTLPYLAALGEQYNNARGTHHTFALIDDHEDRIDLAAGRYDMVWFTAVTPTIHAAYRLSDRARRHGIATVIGGIHATMLPEEAAAHADAVVIGEGEAVVPEILSDWDRDGRLRPIYRGAPTASLERLPLPRWRASTLADYCPWVVPIQTSRGCRNACRFCSTTRYQGAARRHRPVEDIVAEIRALREQGVLTRDKVVFFTDNNIVSDSDHRRGIRDTSYARSLFSALVPLGVQWTGQGEINIGADRELTALMARSGCLSLLVGFETVDQENLRAMGKPSNQVDRYAELIDVLHRHDVSIIGCFIFGLDHDGPEVFDRTAPFIERHVDVPQVSLLTPFPGTALHRRMRNEGRLLHERWRDYDVLHTVFRPRGMSPGELAEGFGRLCRRIYSPAAMLRRALRHASRRRVYSNPQLSFSTRFSSVFAPNLVYRSLARIGLEAPAVGETEAGSLASLPSSLSVLKPA